mgnify:CR=1 FL=1
MRAYIPYQIMKKVKTMSNSQNDEILENLYEQEVERSMKRIKELGGSLMEESDLDHEYIAENVRKQFEELSQ